MTSRKTHTPPNIDRLAFALSNSGAPDAMAQMRQAEGRLRLSRKVPTWANTVDVVFPDRLPLEQCSSEKTAKYKAEVVHRLLPESREMADLTGGFGIDFSFLAPLSKHATYVERQEELCDIARHNFPLFGLQNAEIINTDAATFLAHAKQTDFFFIDPARRDNAGHKTISINDCEPDITQLLPLMLEKAKYVLVKLSPMLDIRQAISALAHVAEIHVVATGGECKELFFVLSAHQSTPPHLHVSDEMTHIAVEWEAETKSIPLYADTLKTFLYEPGPALLKAGLFKWTATHYGLYKLHPNSHLYTAEHFVENFPGRAFRVTGTYSFSKQDIRRLKKVTEQANIAVRNFPESANALRKRLKMRDGGDTYLFATTLNSGCRRIIAGHRLNDTNTTY